MNVMAGIVSSPLPACSPGDGNIGLRGRGFMVSSVTRPRDYVARQFKPGRLLFLLQGTQVGQHLGAGPVLRTYDLSVDAPSGIDDVGLGIHRGTVIEGDLMFRQVAI